MITGEDFLEFAARLAANPQASPIGCRAAISRAYYGAFHLASVMLTDLEISIGRDHGELQRCLGQSSHPSAIKAGILIAELHSKRIKADYRLESEEVEGVNEARRAVEAARDVQSLLRECENETAKTLIRQSIEEYRQRIKPKPR
jgi:uncharacterized protein (UPF0332 family)